MPDYWIKLYIEIIDDPKMATLPDRVWRRVIELFLVAKRANRDGHIPDTRQLAWMLRMNPDELDSDLSQIATTGIIVREVNGWYIPKFAERQAAVPGRERKAQQRAREHSQQYHGNVTDLSRSVTQRAEAETETEAEAEGARQPKGDAFDNMRDLVETVTGYPPRPADVEAIKTFVRLGVTEADLREAMSFLDGKKKVYGASDLLGSATTAHSKRIQGGARTARRAQPAFIPSEEFGL